MLVLGSDTLGVETRFSKGNAKQPPAAVVPQGDDRQRFTGSVTDWSDLGFSICEGYLIETQNLFLIGDAEGFLDLAKAQDDDELEAEVLSHANTLLRGLAFGRNAGRLQVSRTEDGVPLGLNWPAIAALWRAMEVTKGDMRMPRLDPAFERRLGAAIKLN